MQASFVGELIIAKLDKVYKVLTPRVPIRTTKKWVTMNQQSRCTCPPLPRRSVPLTKPSLLSRGTVPRRGSERYRLWVLKKSR